MNKWHEKQCSLRPAREKHFPLLHVTLLHLDRKGGSGFCRDASFQGWIELGLDLLYNRREMPWEKGRLGNRCKMTKKVRFGQGECMCK